MTIITEVRIGTPPAGAGSARQPPAVMILGVVFQPFEAPDTLRRPPDWTCPASGAMIAIVGRKTLGSLEAELRDQAMSYPEATEDHPWGHIAVKVRGKAFVFLGGEKSEKELSITVKLPHSRDMAAELPFAEPSGYGLGKSGWVTARFEKVSDVPMDLLSRWIDESFRAIAPKRLVRELE